MAANVAPAVGAADTMSAVLDVDLPTKELQNTFESLFDEAYEFFSINHDEEAINTAGPALCQRIREEVTAHPILAWTISKNMLRWSLLMVVCEKTYSNPICHDAIKFLIQINPHALVWRRGVSGEDVIHSIAKNNCHCALLPWIAEHFPWVFQYPSCQEDPPHLHLVNNYSNGSCDADVIRQFYELCPTFLEEQNDVMEDGLPLQRCLMGWEECDADLFIWMARKYPEAMSHKDRFGFSALHMACIALSMTAEEGVMAPSQCTENMARISRYLVSECPQSVRFMGEGGRGLPIHLLARRCNRSLVQGVLIILLREYPECIGQNAGNHLPKLSNVPFIQQVAPLLQLQADVEQEQTWLVTASTNFLAYTGSIGMTNVGECFATWTKHRTSIVLQKEDETNQKKLEEICRNFEGEDSDNNNNNDDDGEDDNSDVDFDFENFDD